eukprot:g2361.t1
MSSLAIDLEVNDTSEPDPEEKTNTLVTANTNNEGKGKHRATSSAITQDESLIVSDETTVEAVIKDACKKAKENGSFPNTLDIDTYSKEVSDRLMKRDWVQNVGQLRKLLVDQYHWNMLNLPLLLKVYLKELLIQGGWEWERKTLPQGDGRVYWENCLSGEIIYDEAAEDQATANDPFGTDYGNDNVGGIGNASTAGGDLLALSGNSGESMQEDGTVFQHNSQQGIGGDIVIETADLVEMPPSSSAEWTEWKKPGQRNMTDLDSELADFLSEIDNIPSEKSETSQKKVDVGEGNDSTTGEKNSEVVAASANTITATESQDNEAESEEPIPTTSSTDISEDMKYKSMMIRLIEYATDSKKRKHFIEDEKKPGAVDNDAADETNEQGANHAFDSIFATMQQHKRKKRKKKKKKAKNS